MYENGSNYLKSLKFNLKMSSKVSKGQGLSDFFVFTKDAYLLDQINMKKRILSWILVSSQIIFLLKAKFVQPLLLLNQTESS